MFRACTCPTIIIVRTKVIKARFVRNIIKWGTSFVLLLRREFYLIGIIMSETSETIERSMNANEIEERSEESFFNAFISELVSA